MPSAIATEESMDPSTLLQSGDLDGCLAALQAQIRANPADAKRRVFLFQLLCVRGEWDRALTQLNVAAELDPANLLMAQFCRAALLCEKLRAEVFAGQRTPMVLGEPAEWVGWMIQAVGMTAQGQHAAAAELRAKALEQAPATAGTLNGAPFEWIADADSRLGPMLEAMVDGKYYWCPFDRIREIRVEPPTELRDAVWLPATFRWISGGESFGLIPTRYPGSESEADGPIRLARRTEWRQVGEGDEAAYLGLGQRLLTTDGDEVAVMDLRHLVLGDPLTLAEPGEAAEAPAAPGAGPDHG